jgi:hypothetical protein
MEEVRDVFARIVKITRVLNQMVDCVVDGGWVMAPNVSSRPDVGCNAIIPLSSPSLLYLKLHPYDSAYHGQIVHGTFDKDYAKP